VPHPVPGDVEGHDPQAALRPGRGADRTGPDAVASGPTRPTTTAGSNDRPGGPRSATRYVCGRSRKLRTAMPNAAAAPGLTTTR
jgi:hypothetical protein